MNEDLTQEQVEELGRVLEELEKKLKLVQLSSDETTKPVDLDLPIGRLTRMDAMQQQSMAKANRLDSRLRLRQVIAARELIADGGYGACVRCEEAVGYPRLKARPETRLCVACQEALESSRR